MSAGALAESVPAVTLALANARKARRPSGARAAQVQDPFADPTAALAFLHEVGVAGTGTAVDLEGLRTLRDAVEELVRGLAAGSGIAPAALRLLNEAAQRCGWHLQLTAERAVIQAPATEDLVGRVAALCVRELAAADPSRIKVCDRPDCELYFYDTTRNRSARWHAEDPCGWRARSERRR